MPENRRRLTNEPDARMATFYVPKEVGARFTKAVGHGDRATAIRNLVILADKASNKNRKIWTTLVENPQNLELRRKDGR